MSSLLVLATIYYKSCTNGFSSSGLSLLLLVAHVRSLACLRGCPATAKALFTLFSTNVTKKVYKVAGHMSIKVATNDATFRAGKVLLLSPHNILGPKIVIFTDMFVKLLFLR